MSAYTTLKITRSRARMVAMNYIMAAPDPLLERILDDILHERLYNCRIVEDDAENDEAEAGL